MYRKSSCKPPGDLFISSSFEGGGLIEREGCKFNEVGHNTAFFKQPEDGVSSPKRTTIGRKVEMLKHVTLEVLQQMIRTSSIWINHTGSVHLSLIW